MPSPEQINLSAKDPEEQLFDAVKSKDPAKLKQIIMKYPDVDLNCIDKDELTPLQHVCHNGSLELAKILLDNGAGVNFTRRKDKYTPLMFATISSKPEIVKLLLRRGVDTTVLNCVNRTAAQMACFISQSKIYMIINSWIPFESSVAPYTTCRELEDKPRLPTEDMAKLLHDYIVYPTFHPAKILLYLKDNLALIEHAPKYIYVLEDLSSKSIKPPRNEELLSFKYYYRSYILEYCHKSLKNNEKPFDVDVATKFLDTAVRKLIYTGGQKVRLKPQLDRFALDCIMKFPYTYLAIFKTMTFALSKRIPGDNIVYSILVRTLDGPLGNSENICAVCNDIDDSNKKCSKCKSVYYCSVMCQKGDWFQHKKVCKSPEEEP